jgi:hypothetical protein
MFMKECLSCIGVFERDKSMKIKRGRQVKRKVKRMLIIFFDIKGFVLKEIIMAGQTVNSIYCYYVL